MIVQHLPSFRRFKCVLASWNVLATFVIFWRRFWALFRINRWRSSSVCGGAGWILSPVTSKRVRRVVGMYSTWSFKCWRWDSWVIWSMLTVVDGIVYETFKGCARGLIGGAVRGDGAVMLKRTDFFRGVIEINGRDEVWGGSCIWLDQEFVINDGQKKKLQCESIDHPPESSPRDRLTSVQEIHQR